MILDKGICTVFHSQDVSPPGRMPVEKLVPFFSSWYGVLFVESSPVWPTQGRKELRADKRIRIHQNEDIKENDVVVLLELASEEEIPKDAPRYSVERFVHDLDKDGPTPITDLTLKEISP